MADDPPIGVLLASLSDGEISFAKALELASDPALGSALSLAEASELSRQLLQKSRGPGWRDAVEGLYILRRAANSRPATVETVNMQIRLTLDWIESVKAAVSDVPDAGLFRSARAAARQLRQLARDTEQTRLYGEAAFRLGLLHLDPYTGMRPRQNYDASLLKWLERQRHAGGPQWFEKTDSPMPAPTTAIRLACAYFAKAAECLQGNMRGRSLKALLQARDWLAFLRHQPSPPDHAVASEALALLLPSGDAQAISGLLSDRSLAGHPFPEKTVRETLAALAPPSSGPIGSKQLETVLRLASLSGGPRQAISMLQTAKAEFDTSGNDVFIGARLQMMVGALMQIGREAGVEELAAGSPLANQARKWRKRCDESGHDVPATLGGLFVLAEGSKPPAREAEAIKVLDEWATQAPAGSDAYRDAVEYELASLWDGVGVNNYEIKNWAESATAYAKASAGFLRVGMFDKAGDSIEKVYDVGRREANAAIASVVALAPLADEIRRRLGPGIREVLAAVADAAIRLAPAQRTNGDLLPLLRKLSL